MRRRLSALLAQSCAPMHLLGFAECPFCTLDSHGIAYNDKTIVAGALNLFVPGDGFLYVMPLLAVHHILSDHYARRSVFEAVL
jgi:hypothetical protein